MDWAATVTGDALRRGAGARRAARATPARRVRPVGPLPHAEGGATLDGTVVLTPSSWPHPASSLSARALTLAAEAPRPHSWLPLLRRRRATALEESIEHAQRAFVRLALQREQACATACGARRHHHSRQGRFSSARRPRTRRRVEVRSPRSPHLQLRFHRLLGGSLGRRTRPSRFPARDPCPVERWTGVKTKASKNVSTAGPARPPVSGFTENEHDHARRHAEVAERDIPFDGPGGATAAPLTSAVSATRRSNGTADRVHAPTRIDRSVAS